MNTDQGPPSLSNLKGMLRSKEEREEDRKEEASREGRKEAGLCFREELEVAREAIASLRSMFREADPGLHILDTLDQCVDIIVEKAESSALQQGVEEEEAEQQQPPSTKIIYFMPRSATPFMTSVSRPVGQVTLRDFKVVFDRPGFYR